MRKKPWTISGILIFFNSLQMKNQFKSAGKATAILALILVYIASLTAYFDYIMSREVSIWIQIPVTIAMFPVTWIVIKTTHDFFNNFFNTTKNQEQ